MEFKFVVPTKIFFGEKCVTKNADIFAQLGNTAMIVTGKHSAKASGALRDVIKVMDETILFLMKLKIILLLKRLKKQGRLQSRKKLTL